MTRAQIVQSVTQRVQQVVPDVDVVDIDETANFWQFAGFDSLSFLEIIAWLEMEFGVEVADGELATERFTTVGDIADYLVEALQAGVK